MSNRWNKLTPEEAHIIEHKGTEYPNSGEYNEWKLDGVFVCRRCEAPLYDSTAKFDSHCGWPSFDDTIGLNVERILDSDGRRVEIVCKSCKGHLGHVFEGERMTAKNSRHCVNSLSIKFKARTV
jgi:methionine-R-sulfoxide reductase